jgi:NAD+ synthase
MKFDTDVLKIDPAEEAEKISRFVAGEAKGAYRRTGVVVGLSGGVDSAVMAELAVRAMGREHVYGLILPEKESSPVSSSYARMHAEKMGIQYREVDITPTVESVVSYGARDEFIRRLVPEYAPGCRYNITLPTDLLERDSYNFYNLQVLLPDGTVKKKRLNPDAFRTITSFANIKIRSRMIHLYAEAERKNCIVAGTTNRTEFILGDFCKYGDGGTDIEALGHVYKNQVYQLARYLGVIPEIIERPPSPDTFSLPVSDQEFFFRISFDKLDLLLYAWEHQVSAGEAARVLEISEEAVNRAFTDFSTKNRATSHLRELPHSMAG